jgi:hypothetical protein
LTVGPGRRFLTLASAIAAARDGDVIEIQSGTYTDDFAVIGVRLTIRAVGGMAHLRAVASPPNGKAILVAAADLSIEGLVFTGCAVPSQNGAGIRYEAGQLVLRRCSFHSNQMNLLAAPHAAGSITIERCEFGPTVANATLAHSLYVNQLGQLTVRDSLFHGAATGHQIKSRAFATTITGTRVFEVSGHGAYSIDLPNGGRVMLTGNVIEQGPTTQNPALLHFGGEGTPHVESSLRVTENLVINRFAAREALLLRNQTEARATLVDNRVFGLGPDQLAAGPAEVRGTVFLRDQPTLDMAPPWLGR